MTTLAYKNRDLSIRRLAELIFWTCAVVAYLPVCSAGDGQPGNTKKPRLVWVVRIDEDPLFRLHSMSPKRLQGAEIAFLDSENLALSFHDGRPWTPPFALPGRKLPNPTAEEAEREFGYHALFLRQRDGAILHRMTWKTRNDNSLLLPTRGGGFLLLAGQKLTLYNAEFQTTHEMAIPAKPTPGWRHSDFWSAARCLDSDVFVLTHTLDRSTTYQWLTVPDFNHLGTAELTGFGRFSCTETQIAKAWVPNIMIATRGTATGFVASCNECKAYGVDFLDNGHLVVLRGHDFQVLATSWDKMGSGKLENTVQVVSNAPAAGAFALGSTTITGGEWIFTIRVFNWKTAQMVMTMRFRKEQLQRGWDRGFNDLALALSPDGSRFVVLKDGALEMYALE